MQLSQNYFELFDLPVALAVDGALLAGRYRELQKALHPDRYAGASEREQRLAVQYTAHLNDAYTTLRDPVRRVQYMLRLKGRDLASEAVTTQDSGFLLQQMRWRESLEEARHAADPLVELERLETEVEQETQRLLDTFAPLYQDAGEQALQQAVDCGRKLQFMEKMRRELEALEEDLTDF